MQTQRSPRLGAILAILIGVGCKPAEPVPDAPSPRFDEDGTFVVDTDDTGVVIPTTDTAVEEVYDCSQIPLNPISNRQIAWGTGYHDLAFTTDGRMIGNDQNNMKWAEENGGNGLLFPSVGTVQGMDFLLTGELIVASDAQRALYKMDVMNPGLELLTADLQAYGVVVGPNGYVYAADYNKVWRVDPATGEKQTFLNPNFQPRVINFSPKYDFMYIGTRSASQGKVYRVHLDADLLPDSAIQVFATGVGTGAYHDALGVDACGNLYMTDYSTNNLYRISPEGYVDLYADLSYSEHGHGLKWGNGIGGWRSDAIYMPQPYNSNQVVEVVIGVPSRYFTGTVILP